MTNIKSLSSSMPSYAKDIKINLQNLISNENKVLTEKQIFGAALAAAYATREKTVMINLAGEAKFHMSKSDIEAVKAATAIMSMNNIYYRFLHISADKDYLKMPAGLRMQILKNHGVDEVDFEIYSLSVSIINGCSGCIDAHANQIVKHGLSKEQVQMVAKIAAIVNAAATVMEIEEVTE